MISAKFVFLFFLYVNCFKLGVEIAFNSRSAANHNKKKTRREGGKRRVERHSVSKHVAAHCNVLCQWMLQQKKKSRQESSGSVQ